VKYSKALLPGPELFAGPEQADGENCGIKGELKQRRGQAMARAAGVVEPYLKRVQDPLYWVDVFK